jgi:hypothetical protein
MSSNAPTFFVPSDPYLDSLTALAGNRDPVQFSHGLKQIIDRANSVKLLPQRNRLWFDVVHLLGKSWSRELQPRLFDRDELLATRKLLDDADDLPTGLQELTDAVLSDNWANFDEFQSSDQGGKVFDFDVENWLGEYNDWLDRYLPYILLPLPADVASADLVLKSRIAWMVDKVAPEENDPSGLRETFLDKAWMYARAHWNGAPDLVTD